MGWLDKYPQGGKVKDNIQSDEGWLENWYSNRHLQNPYLEGALNLDRGTIENRYGKENITADSTQISPDYHVMGQYTGDNNIKINPSTLVPNSPNEYTDIHEYDHYLNNFPSYTRTTNSQVINDNIKPNLDPKIYSPDEVHARLMQLRRIAGFKPDQPVDSAQLDQFINRAKTGDLPYNNDIDQLFKGVKNTQSLLNLLNETTYNTPSQTGWLSKYI